MKQASGPTASGSADAGVSGSLFCDDASSGRPRQEPLAVVGLGCRYPGGADSAEQLWQLLVDERDVITEVPADRWDVERYYDPEPGVRGHTVSRWGGFLDDIGGFEPDFFGITEREAESMDPQQRLMLEVCWEALEDAGVVPRRLAGSRTGVFVGLGTQDHFMWRPFGEVTLDPYAMTGNARSIASGRISYLLGLHGPAVTVDSACSSSLVAVHLAAQSLRTGESDLALAGGVQVNLAPEMTLAFSAWNMLSPHGRCKAFDRDGAGYVRSEGAGVVALKRLADAERDGDRILAVLRGSGLNQDGRSQGLTAPSATAQAMLQRDVLAAAGIDASDVGLVEAHGTGTPVGDPIEFAGLDQVYGAGHQPCALGAIKTNIGHAETAAGMAGFIKAVQALRHAQIPANLHFTGWNAEIDATASRLFVPTKLQDWPVTGRPRLAAVSSYGMSGTNAHVLLEQAPEPSRRASASPRPVVVPVSAGSPAALAATAARLAAAVTESDEQLDDIVATLGCRVPRRSRAAVTASSTIELAERLTRLADPGAVVPGVVTGTIGRADRAPVWVFSGQGSQWAGMAHGLLDVDPAFTHAIDTLQPIVLAESGYSLRAALTDVEVVTGIDRVQPALFAMQVALAASWRARGLAPGAVVGHSMGEVAAAFVAGALDLADAATVICRRSRLLATQISGRGAMAVVDLPASEVAQELGDQGSVVVAVINSPGSCVVAGDPVRVRALVAAYEDRDVMAREVAVDVASHSPQVDPLLDDLRAALAGLRPRTPDVPFYSTVDDGVPAFDADYWAQNLRRPVRFADAIARAVADGHRLVVEVSPHPVLTRAVAETAGEDTTVLATMRRGEEPQRMMAATLATLFCAGAVVEWPRTCAPAVLPPTVWARRHMLVEPGREPARAAGSLGIGHPLLGTGVGVPGGGRLWEGEAGLDAHPWLADHRLLGEPVLPGTGFVEIALAAAAECGIAEVRDVRPAAVLALDARTTINTRLRGHQLEILCDGTVHATAVLGDPVTASMDGDIDVPTLLAGQDPPIAPDAHLDRLRSRGVDLGDQFVALRALHLPGPGSDVVVGRLGLPGDLRQTASAFRWHPALFDACVATASAHPRFTDRGGVFVPEEYEVVRVFGDVGHAAWCVGRLTATGARTAHVEVRLYAADGRLLAEAFGIRLGVATPAWQDGATPGDRTLEVSWDDVPLTAPIRDPRPVPRSWVVLAEESGDLLADWLVAGLGSATLVCAPPDAPMTSLPVGPGTGVVVLCPPPVGEPGAGDVTKAEARAARLAAVATMMVGVEEVRLWGVTRGAQVLSTGDPVTLEQSTLRGVLRVVGHEHPELAPVHIDLPAITGAEVLTDVLPDLLAELRAARTDDEVAWRDGSRQVARVRVAPLRRAERRHRSIHFGRDNYVVDGVGLQAADRRSPAAGEVEVAVEAFAPDGDVAGRIVAVGEGMDSLTVGEAVAVLGAGTAGFVTVPRGQVLATGAYPALGAATMPRPHLLAHDALAERARLRAGEEVLILGDLGGGDLAAVADVAGALGARVTGPEPGDAPADVVVDPGDAPERALSLVRGGGTVLFASAPSAEVLTAANERGVSVVVASTVLTDPCRVASGLAAVGAAIAAGERHPITRRAARLVPRSGTGRVPINDDAVVRSDGAYVVTGGLGGLGLLVAAWLGARGARRIVLNGRSAPSAYAELVLDELREGGVDVCVELGDLAAPGTAERLVAAGAAEGTTLRGILHAAVVVEDRVLADVDAGHVAKVCRPKTLGAWRLHEALTAAGVEPDWWCGFSSGSGLLGTPGQTAYAAANTWLDAFVAWRRAMGHVGVSIAWGAWAEVGLGTGYAERGFEMIEPDEGIAAMERFLLHDRVRAGYLPIRCERWRAVWGDQLAASSFFAPLRPPRGPEHAGAERESAVLVEPSSAATAPAVWSAAQLADLVGDEAQAVLRVERDAVEAHRSLADLGLDSLMALELRSRLERRVGLRVPTKVLWARNSPAELADYLVQELA